VDERQAPRLLTSDCHFLPPPSLAEELPEPYRRYFLHLERRDDGVYLVKPGAPMQADPVTGPLYINPSVASINSGVKVKDPEDETELARLVQGDVARDSRPSFKLADLIVELEADGVHGGVLITSVVGPTGDIDADVALCQLVNDWVSEECEGALDRFAPGIQLPLMSIGESIKELERAAGLGLRPALLPDVLPARHWLDPAWEPLWEAAEGLGIPISMHVSDARGGWPWSMATAFAPGVGITGSFAIASVGMAETALWLAGGGILERHPDLKVVFTECGAGWLAWAMQYFDECYLGRFGNEYLTDMGMPNMRHCEFPPSFYLKRQTAFTFMNDPVAVQNRMFTGIDSLMWGNDWPHTEGTHPHSIEAIKSQFAGVTDAEVRAVVHDNAARVFRLAE
jgi:predicted TIM-barrel fold metal-dependent hydrolase